MPEPKRQRNFRIEDSKWEALREAAEKNDETVSDVLRRLADTYVEETNR